MAEGCFRRVTGPGIEAAEVTLWITSAANPRIPYSGRMRKRNRWWAVGLVLALAVSGCAPEAERDEATVVPVMSPTTSNGVFISNDEAVAAASAAYERFNVVEIEVGQAGGVGRERFAEVAADPFLTELNNGYAQLETDQQRVEGASTFDAARIQERWMEADGEHISIFACVDSSNIRLFDAAGVDISTGDQRKRMTMQIKVVAKSRDEVRVTGNEIWSTEDC